MKEATNHIGTLKAIEVPGGQDPELLEKVNEQVNEIYKKTKKELIEKAVNDAGLNDDPEYKPIIKQIEKMMKFGKLESCIQKLKNAELLEQNAQGLPNEELKENFMEVCQDDISNTFKAYLRSMSDRVVEVVRYDKRQKRAIILFTPIVHQIMFLPDIRQIQTGILMEAEKINA